MKFLALAKLPKHIAIIMDGNGRWAQLRRRDRSFGHIKGTRVAKKIITECSRIGIQHLTLYAFSAENWLRPDAEVSLLMRILRRYLNRETQNLIKENIRFTVIGKLNRLPKDVLTAVESAMAATSSCTGLHLVFAISYGSRPEITDAVRQIAELVKLGVMSTSEIDEDTIASHLQTNGTPDPDLVIRTSGEQRLSNFLMWQAAYSEFYFTSTLWPDFSKEDLHLALLNYQNRQRRFGRISVTDEELHH